MAHEDLVSYYKLNFALMQHHKYSLTELENMIPWEREIYVYKPQLKMEMKFEIWEREIYFYKPQLKNEN